jgi:hypothetical protein
VGCFVIIIICILQSHCSVDLYSGDIHDNVIVFIIVSSVVCGVNHRTKSVWPQKKHDHKNISSFLRPSIIVQLVFGSPQSSRCVYVLLCFRFSCFLHLAVVVSYPLHSPRVFQNFFVFILLACSFFSFCEWKRYFILMEFYFMH